MESIVDAKQKPQTKPCIACCEQIHANAKVCHHCGKSQANDRWHHVSSILKWAGGITAVFSLVMTLVQVNNLMGDWRYKQTAMNRILYAANIQRDDGDLLTAWNSYKKILDIDPSNQQVFQEQLILVKQWLQTAPVYYKSAGNRTSDVTLSQYLDGMITILYQGLVGLDNSKQAAEIYAYVAWVNIIKSQYHQPWSDAEKLRQTAFKTINKAMLLDDGNLLVNAINTYIPYTTIGREEVWKSYLPSIEKVIYTKNPDSLVNKIKQLILTDLAPAYYLFKYANYLREKNLDTDFKFRKQFIHSELDEIFVKQSDSLDEIKNILTALPANDALQTINFIFDGYKEGERVQLHVAEVSTALINEFSGDKQSALNQFKSIVQTADLDPNNFYEGAVLKLVTNSIERLSAERIVK